MSLAFDVRGMSDERRHRLAWLAHESTDRNLPTLTAWNYDPCEVHARGWIDESEITRYSPKPDCRHCAIIPRAHQRVGALWLYLTKKALLADTTGAGKSAQAGLLIAMMIQTGELSLFRDADGGRGRVILVPTAPTLGQWEKELLRMMPGLNIVVASGGISRPRRLEMYQSDWQVLLIGPEMFRNDHTVLDKLHVAALIVDDVDALRNRETATSATLDGLGRKVDRYVIMNATPLQKRLLELYDTLDAIGGERVFGGRSAFERTHIDRNPSGGLRYRRVDTVIAKMAPLTLRRTPADIDDVDMPDIVPSNHMLDLYPRQRAKYEELRQGVLRLLRDERVVVKRVTAVSKLHYGSAICAGLGSLGTDDLTDGPGASVKLDWILDRLDGEFEGDKIVIFARLKNTITDLQFRLRERQIGFTTIWGNESRKDVRAAALERFREDPRCRILLGTSAIVRGLNLQVSRRLINVDMIMNQAQMHQLAGRVQRIGSAHSTVYVHNLLTVDTQEERYLPMLERESALASRIWGEESQLFEQLSSVDLLRLITG